MLKNLLASSTWQRIRVGGGCLRRRRSVAFRVHFVACRHGGTPDCPSTQRTPGAGCGRDHGGCRHSSLDGPRGRPGTQCRWSDPPTRQKPSRVTAGPIACHIGLILAPRPGLEPGTCGLQVPGSFQPAWTFSSPWPAIRSRASPAVGAPRKVSTHARQRLVASACLLGIALARCALGFPELGVFSPRGFPRGLPSCQQSVALPTELSGNNLQF